MVTPVNCWCLINHLKVLFRHFPIDTTVESDGSYDASMLLESSRIKSLVHRNDSVVQRR